ncbi:MAG: TlpA family protein disulfide reductase [Gammaproteobacteria bacterium]|nr:TlpA family protein disulfide reductase [Gammaproteobacteria bacterium]
MIVIRYSIVILLFMVSTALTAGDSADYELRDMDGKIHRVSDYRGKWLVINFWATWCPPCLAEMPELERFYQENNSRAQVWGVTFEDGDKAQILKFIEKLGVTYPILGFGQDPLTGFGDVTVLPTTFVIDRDGLFFHRFEGPITAQDIVDVVE